MTDSTQDSPTQSVSTEAGDVSQKTSQSLILSNNEEDDGDSGNTEDSGGVVDENDLVLDEPETLDVVEMERNTTDISATGNDSSKGDLVENEIVLTNVAGNFETNGNDNSIDDKEKQEDAADEKIECNITIDKKTYEDMVMDQKRLKDEFKRLKEHLIMVEDDYTTEILELEARESKVKDELKQSQEIITQLQASLSGISQNQSSAEQLDKLREERDRALDDVSKLDDKVHSLTAAVTNLQLVIEQIQKENEKKLKVLSKQHQEAIEAERSIQNDLRHEVEIHEKKSMEAAQALQAATRLTENIDTKEKTIQTLKQELNEKDSQISNLELEIANLKSSFEGKVDKQVIKNLILGYFGTPNDKKHEVERLLARVLDFNEQEMARAGLSFGRPPNKFTLGPTNITNPSTPSPTGSILLAPLQTVPNINSSSGSPVSIGSNPSSNEPNPGSLSKMFVEFLESESRPKGIVPNLSASSLTRELARDLTKVALNSNPKSNLLLESTLKSKASQVSGASSPTSASLTSSSSSSSLSSLVSTRGLQQQTGNHVLSTNGKSLNPLLAPANSLSTNKLSSAISGSSPSAIRPITINSNKLMEQGQPISTGFSSHPNSSSIPSVSSSSSVSASSLILNSMPSLNTAIKPITFDANQPILLPSSSSSSNLTSLPLSSSSHFLSMPETTSQITSSSLSAIPTATLLNTNTPVTSSSSLLTSSNSDYNPLLSNLNLKMKKG